MFENLFYPLFKRNLDYKGKHQGQTCYIVGNGVSLNYMDLSLFNEYPAIGINCLFLHKDYSRIDLQYMVFPESFGLYPMIRNTYNNKYQENILGKMAVKAIQEYPNVTWFTSLTNVLAGLPMKNVRYHYHFGQREPSSDFIDLCGKFSFMKGGLHAALGLAVAMGFSRLLLIGCDYLHNPTIGGHFYSLPLSSEGDSRNIYSNLLDALPDDVAVEIVTPFDQGCWLPHHCYKNWKGVDPVYKGNQIIVSQSDLACLNRAFQLGQLTNPVTK